VSADLTWDGKKTSRLFPFFFGERRMTRRAEAEGVPQMTQIQTD